MPTPVLLRQTLAFGLSLYLRYLQYLEEIMYGPI